MHKKLFLNADIEKLISQKKVDLDSAQNIINFAKDIPVSHVIKKMKRKKNSNTNSKITGYTPEHGNIEVNDDRSQNNNDFEETTDGWYLERVGKYKVWRNHEDEIHFRYWKNEFRLWGEENESLTEYDLTYYLIYDLDTFEPTSFGNINYRLMERFIPFRNLLFSTFKFIAMYILSFGRVKIFTQAFVERFSIEYEEKWSK